MATAAAAARFRLMTSFGRFLLRGFGSRARRPLRLARLLLRRCLLLFPPQRAYVAVVGAAAAAAAGAAVRGVRVGVRAVIFPSGSPAPAHISAEISSTHFGTEQNDFFRNYVKLPGI